MPGAIFTLLGLVATRVLSSYVFVNWLEWYGKYYGGLGIVMALFFWVTIPATILVLAAALSPAFAHRRDLRQAARRLGVNARVRRRRLPQHRLDALQPRGEVVETSVAVIVLKLFRGGSRDSVCRCARSTNDDVTAAVTIASRAMPWNITTAATSRPGTRRGVTSP